MKRKFIILFTLLLMLIAKVSYAEDVISAEIVCNSRNVSISGSLPNTSKPMAVTLLIGDVNNIIYMNQITTSASGVFDFSFVMPRSVEAGVYNIAIGTNADVSTYYGYIYYNMAESTFLTADLDIILSAYVPTLSGTVSCAQGKTTNFSIVNITDNSTICSEEITSDTGVFNLSYTLPSLISNKEYRLVITCCDSSGTVVEIAANIDSSILAVDVTGDITVASGKQLDTHVRTTNTNIINRQQIIEGNKSISATIPNLLPSAAFKITANGYEMVPMEEEPLDTYTANGVAGEEFRVIAYSEDVISFDDKTYTLTYDETQIEPVSFFAMQYEDFVGTGKRGNVNIISYTPGEVVFSIEDIGDKRGRGQKGTYIFRGQKGTKGDVHFLSQKD